MTYVLSAPAGDIAGTMLICSKGTATGGSYTMGAPWTAFATHAIFPDVVIPIKTTDWEIVDTTGSFNAIDHDGAGNFTNVSNTYVTLKNSKKVLVKAYFAATGHSSTTKISSRISTNNLTSVISTGVQASACENSSSLTAYFGPDSPLGGADSRSENFPDELNDTTTGEYFLRANIRKLQDEILYAFIETPSSGIFNLCCRHISKAGSPANAYNTTDANAHFIQIIQFS